MSSAQDEVDNVVDFDKTLVEEEEKGGKGFILDDESGREEIMNAR